MQSAIPETRYAKNGGVNIAYQVVGDGPVDLVLVHGFVSHLELDWDEPAMARFLDRIGRYIADRIPNARFVELAGDVHVPFVDSDQILDEVEEFVTGRRPIPHSNRVLATVLFTDIVGSTERAATMGDRAWRELLDRHHSLVRRELDRFHGREVDTAGDGFLATFDGPARAIRCAGSVREAVRGLGLELRAGLHTGECELIGDQVRGIAVHTGARVAALAGPSEVLVSSTVRDLVAGSGLEFEDRGTHELKGVPGEWRLYAVSNV